MANLDNLLLTLEGKSDEEIVEILRQEYGVLKHPDPQPESERVSFKKWYAKVFTYCRNDQLQDLITDFLNEINTDKKYIDVCFKHEDTVFLGCTCSCGRKQTILYYTLTHEENE